MLRWLDETQQNALDLYSAKSWLIPTPGCHLFREKRHAQSAIAYKRRLDRRSFAWRRAMSSPHWQLLLSHVRCETLGFSEQTVLVVQQLSAHRGGSVPGAGLLGAWRSLSSIARVPALRCQYQLPL